METTQFGPAVYARQADLLKHQLTRYLAGANPATVQGEIFALIAPNTNLLRGAPVAADVYTLLTGSQYDTVVLIAPSRVGTFQRLNICQVNEYHTPLGTLAINDRMRHELCDEDDDIFLDDSGHFDLQGSDVQLPYLQTILGAFDVVPVVMGDESPEFCRELGHAIGEVTYNQRALIVASMDVRAASDEHLATFRAGFEACDVPGMMALLNSERVEVVGKGPLLVAMIAAQHRRISGARVVSMEAAVDDAPGFVGAVLLRE